MIDTLCFNRQKNSKSGQLDATRTENGSIFGCLLSHNTTGSQVIDSAFQITTNATTSRPFPPSASAKIGWSIQSKAAGWHHKQIKVTNPVRVGSLDPRRPNGMSWSKRKGRDDPYYSQNGVQRCGKVFLEIVFQPHFVQTGPIAFFKRLLDAYSYSW